MGNKITLCHLLIVMLLILPPFALTLAAGLTHDPGANPTAASTTDLSRNGTWDLVTEFSAVGDGQTLNTEAIQKAIDERHAAGGGTVVIPPGVFLTGTIKLKSNITLYLENGAILRGSPDLDDYLHHENGTPMGIIFAMDTKNIAVTGMGTIDGNGRAFVYPDRKKRSSR